ncbi:hypothetical protein HPP92_001781 [Vanilla planifolia]|uniref:Uncharacterized protein n=1 Tax=Vanilla planifolia TaxID=51239 RepID=A0A835VE33_VANPL|nr:hypothetical protein HPP92_001995 [Vanilla planifolia]KAG0501709.1 hypothetical protein HPP92_001781 [Vanilla planifolia]
MFLRVSLSIYDMDMEDIDVDGMWPVCNWLESDAYFCNGNVNVYYEHVFLRLTIEPRRNTGQVTIRGYGELYHRNGLVDNFQFLSFASPPPPSHPWNFRGTLLFVNSDRFIFEYPMNYVGREHPHDSVLWSIGTVL